jgi:hypothetical protein
MSVMMEGAKTAECPTDKGSSLYLSQVSFSAGGERAQEQG